MAKMFTCRTIVNMHFTSIVLLCLVQYLSAKTCGNFEVTVTQALLEQGFHRNLTYTIGFNFEDDQCTVRKGCMIGLKQTLPSGTYVSNDELNDLRRNNRVMATLKNRINIELPAEQSHPYSVYLISNKTENTENDIVIWLPVHARYHKAVSGGGTSRIDIEPPKVYLTCPDPKFSDDLMDKTLSQVKFPCIGSPKEKCTETWKEISFTMLTDTIIWHVPVGNLHHYYTVSLTTGLIVAVASLYVCKAVHGEYRGNRNQK